MEQQKVEKNETKILLGPYITHNNCNNGNNTDNNSNINSNTDNNNSNINNNTKSELRKMADLWKMYNDDTQGSLFSWTLRKFEKFRRIRFVSL